MKSNDFLRKNKELISYLFFGAITTAVSIASFAFFEYLRLDVLVANILSWILSVFVAFVTNTLWVFGSDLKQNVISKTFKFYTARIFTLIVEEALLYVFIKKLGFDSLVIKCIAQILVIILNYIISKLLIFGNKGQEKE